MVGIKSKINQSPGSITTSKRWAPLTTIWVSLQHFNFRQEAGGGFAKVSPIHLKIKHSGDHSLTTLLGHSKTPLLWRLILFDSEPKAWFSDVTITCSTSQGQLFERSKCSDYNCLCGSHSNCHSSGQQPAEGINS